MSPVDAISGTSSTQYSGKSEMALDIQDFMAIMISELTNQDPLDPMSNKDLVDQMASIQQLQSSTTMTESFTDMMDRLDLMLVKEELSSARQTLGQFISGTSVDGNLVAGTVIGINIDENEVLLELDNGYLVNMSDVQRLGAQSSQDVIGTVVIGPSSTSDKYVAGVVKAINVSDTASTFLLESGEEIAINSAIQLTEENASLLINQQVIGYTDIDDSTTKISGFVASISLSAEGITVKINVGESELIELPLENITEVDLI